MKEFIKPWMKKCNQDLILKFWRSKGSPGKLTITRYGICIEYTNTPFGELTKIVRPDLIKAVEGLNDHLDIIFEVHEMKR